jgi:hypothetical protein
MNRLVYHYESIKSKYSKYADFHIEYKKHTFYETLVIQFKNNYYTVLVENSTGGVSVSYNLLKNKAKNKEKVGYSIDNIFRFLRNDLSRRIKEEYR